jgi:6-phosphogluconolactonase
MSAAALRSATLSGQAIANHGRFTFVLSGGSTPRQLYSLLASEKYVSTIDWTHVDFFWGDERCVEPDHPDSNYRMARESLLDVIKPDPSRVHRMLGEELPERAAAAYEALLHKFFMVAPHGPPPSFDLVLLGMGPDGHTASLFPGTAALDETVRWVVPNWVPETEARRLTMTFPILNAATNVLFLVTGADKAERVKQVLEHTPGSEALPAARIRPTSGLLEWMLDTAAASRLESAE